MADMPTAAPVEGISPATSSAENQARLRKERREAKIKAGGSARLNKITGLGGGVQREPPKASEVHADPEEIDISNHYYEPATTRRPNATSPSSGPQGQMNDDALRQMMLNPFDSAAAPQGGPQQNPFAGFPGMGSMPGMEGAPDPSDPMMKMLQQMMGGMPQEGANGMPEFPGMEGLGGLGAGFPGMPGGASPEATNQYAYLWRIVHAVFALGLGLYIALATPFSGTWVERERSGVEYTGVEDVSQATFKHFFWIFATTELLLQTSRFFMEKGKVAPAGMMGMVMGFLPEPFKGYLTLFLRYSRIWTTISADAMCCIFILGVCAWLRS